MPSETEQPERCAGMEGIILEELSGTDQHGASCCVNMARHTRDDDGSSLAKLLYPRGLVSPVKSRSRDHALGGIEEPHPPSREQRTGTEEVLLVTVAS